jgi:hypothetical protein
MSKEGRAISFAGSLTDDPEPLRTAGIHRQPIADNHSNRIPQDSPSWFN